jgi:hypothetical protein
VAAVRNFLSLSAHERRCKLEAAAELTRASLQLKVRPSRAARRLGTLTREDGTEVPSHAEAEEARRVGRAVAGAAGRLPWHPTCLRQALAVQRMLRRRGIASELHLGVTGVLDSTAHAWVTVGGEAVVGGQGIERFVPLAAFR